MRRFRPSRKPAFDLQGGQRLSHSIPPLGTRKSVRRYRRVRIIGEPGWWQPNPIAHIRTTQRSTARPTRPTILIESKATPETWRLMRLAQSVEMCRCAPRRTTSPSGQRWSWVAIGAVLLLILLAGCTIGKTSGQASSSSPFGAPVPTSTPCAVSSFDEGHDCAFVVFPGGETFRQVTPLTR